ncbi:hypothetical protein D3C86_1257770 [compost metagenome]
MKTAAVAVFDGIADARHLRQADHRAVFMAHDQAAVFRRGARLLGRAHFPALAGRIQLAQRAHGRGIGNGVAHIVQRHAVVRQGVGVDLHAHGGQRTAAHRDFAHAIDLRQLLRQHRRPQVIKLAGGARGRTERQRHDGRLRGVDLAVAGVLRHARGQFAARCIDGGLHVAGGFVDVAVQLKLQLHAGGALVAGRGHGADAGDAAQGALKRRGHGAGHAFRAGAGKFGAHLNRGEIHLRQRGNGQQPPRHRTQQGQRQRQEDAGDGAMQQRAYHGCGPSALAGLFATLPRRWPSR